MHFSINESENLWTILSFIGIFQEFEKLFSNEKLLNLMEQILGTKEIVGHPVWNMRTKTPQNEATTVPWHQGTL